MKYTKELAVALCTSDAPIVQGLNHHWMDQRGNGIDPIEIGKTYLAKERVLKDYPLAVIILRIVIVACIVMAITFLVINHFVAQTTESKVTTGAGMVMFSLLALYAGHLYRINKKLRRECNQWVEDNDLKIEEFVQFVKSIDGLLDETGWELTVLLELEFEQARTNINTMLLKWGRVAILLEPDPLVGEVRGQFQSDTRALFQIAKKFSIPSGSSLADYIFTPSK